MIVEDLIVNHTIEISIMILGGRGPRAILAVVHLRTNFPDHLIATAETSAAYKNIFRIEGESEDVL
jgi:hypothetical protein